MYTNPYGGGMSQGGAFSRDFFKKLPNNREEGLVFHINRMYKTLYSDCEKCVSSNLGALFQQRFGGGSGGMFGGMFGRGNSGRESQFASSIVSNGGIPSLMKLLENIVGGYKIEEFSKYDEFSLNFTTSAKTNAKTPILPENIVMNICYFLTPRSVIRVSRSCKAWNLVLSTNEFWKELYLHHSRTAHQTQIDTEKGYTELQQRLRNVFEIYEKREEALNEERNWKNHYVRFYFSFVTPNTSNIDKRYLEIDQNRFIPYYVLHSVASLARISVVNARAIISKKRYVDTIVKYLYNGVSFVEQYAAVKFFKRIVELGPKDKKIFQICTRDDVMKMMVYLARNVNEIVFRKFYQHPGKRIGYAQDLICEVMFDIPDNVTRGDYEKRVIFGMGKLRQYFENDVRDFIKDIWSYYPQFTRKLVEKYNLLEFFRDLLTRPYRPTKSLAGMNRVDYFKEFLSHKQGREVLARHLDGIGGELVKLVFDSCGIASYVCTACDAISFMTMSKKLCRYLLKEHFDEIVAIVKNYWGYREPITKNFFDHRFQDCQEFTKVANYVRKKMYMSEGEKKKKAKEALTLRLNADSLVKNGKIREAISQYLAACEIMPYATAQPREYNVERAKMYAKIATLYWKKLKDFENCIKYTIWGSFTEGCKIPILARILAKKEKNQKDLGFVEDCLYYNQPMGGSSMFGAAFGVQSTVGSKEVPESMYEKEQLGLDFDEYMHHKVYGWKNLERFSVYNYKEMDEYIKKIEKDKEFMPPARFVGKEKEFLDDYQNIPKNPLAEESPDSPKKKKDGKKKNGRKCAYCSSPATKKCSACKSVVYCNRDCQVKHWKTHKTDCKKIRKQNKK